MPKKKRTRKPRNRPKGKRHPTPRQGSGGRQTSEPDLMVEVRRRMREEHPFALLAHASSLYAAFDPRNRNPFKKEADEGVDREEVLASLLDMDLPETSALLYVVGELTDDELMKARIRRELSTRTHALPGWLTRMGEVEPYRPTEMRHVLRDGENIMFGVRLPAGHEMTAVVYIDHNLGTVVKDAFIVPEPLDETISFTKDKQGADPDIYWNEIAQADARARVTEAIDRGAITFPPLETDSWPACRPLLEWFVRMLPEGGSGYERYEWEQSERGQLADRFLGSSFASDLRNDPHIPDLLETLLRYGCDYGPGDPLHWSPVAVEIFLTSWLPRKIDAPVDYLDKAPDLLRAFVRFAHHERGLRASITEETLDAVGHWEPEYRETIRTDRPIGPMAILDAMGVLDEKEGEGPRLIERTGASGGWDRMRVPREVPAEIEEAVRDSTVLQRFRVVTDYYGDGRKLTQKGNPTLADARSLISLLGTQDRMDRTIGDRTFKTQSAVELPELMFTLQWAIKAGALRKEHGKLRATARWRRLADRPGEQWRKAADALPVLGPLATFQAHARYRGTGEIVDEVFHGIVSMLLAGPAEWDEALDVVCDYAEKNFEWRGYWQDPDFRRRSFDRDLDLLATILGWAGVAERVGADLEPDDVFRERHRRVGGVLRLTEPGLWWLGAPIES